MTKSASESPLESLSVLERDIESVAREDKNVSQGDSAQFSPISEEQVEEIQARLKRWDRGEVSKQTFPVSWAEADALCRSLRAAWAELREWENNHDRLCLQREQMYRDVHAENDALRTQNQTQAESITYFQENEKSLKAQLVNAVIPYEALLIDVESRKWIAPSVWKEIESTVAAIRAVVKGENLQSGAGETMSNEKDRTTAFELVRDYGGTDNAGLLRRRIEGALTTARKEARAEAFKEAIAAVPQVGVTFPEGYEEWIDAPSYRETVIAALEAAATTQKERE